MTDSCEDSNSCAANEISRPKYKLWEILFLFGRQCHGASENVQALDLLRSYCETFSSDDLQLCFDVFGPTGFKPLHYLCTKVRQATYEYSILV